MAFAKLDNINLYYEEKGEGDAILFIMGLGMPGFAWEPQVEYFSRKYRSIIFDNRGVGKSDKPPGPYTTRQMAEDAFELLNYLGIKSAHIVGISMGGMIAQQMTLNYPDMVKSATFCATYAKPDENVRKHVQEGAEKLGISLKFEDLSSVFPLLSQMNDSDTIKRLVDFLLPLTLSRGFIEKSRDMLDGWLKRMMENPPTINSFISQVIATQTHDTLDELKNINCPVLVLTGTEDLLVPPVCSKIISQNISKAKLLEIPGGPHGINIECAEEFNSAVEDFINSV